MANYSLNDQLSQSSTSQNFKAEKNIFSYGDKVKQVYLILEGLVRLFVQNNGEEEEIARLGSGDIVGEAALLEKNNYISRAETAQETTLLAFNPEDLKSLMHQEPILNENIITTLCSRIQWLQESNLKLPPLNQPAQVSNPEETTPEANNESDEESEKKTKNNTIKINKPEDFYLPGHQEYDITADSTLAQYTYNKEITCPICQSKSTVKKVRNSKLRLKTIRDDLRPIYKNFAPAWYKVWICPNCFYAARKADFFDFSSRQEKKIKNNFKKQITEIFGTDYQPQYSEPRTINQVFNAYYLAIKLYNSIAASPGKLGYLWLRLSWLYEDVKAEELSEAASLKAMTHLQEFYFNSSTTKLPRPQEDKLTLLLALLLAKHEHHEKALPLLDDLIRSPQTNPRQKQIARDKFIELRRQKKEQSRS